MLGGSGRRQGADPRQRAQQGRRRQARAQPRDDAGHGAQDSRHAARHAPDRSGWLRHRTTQAECEQVFFNRPLVYEDDIHSHEEVRYYALGQSDAGRLLLVVYTLREERVRVISARDMTRRERKEYERGRAQELEADPEV